MSKNNNFIIVMYHHVRKKNEKFYPKLKSLDFNIFVKQLDYLQKKYHIINQEDLCDFFINKKKFNKKLCMLTFDDGYINHFNNVYPELKKRNLQGFFFPPSKAIISKKLMDSNKVHILLASKVTIKKLNVELKKIYSELNIQNKTKMSFENLEKKYKKPFGFDKPEVILFKRVMQFVIPLNLRNKVFDKLFKKFIKHNEKALAKNLYITLNNAKEMVANGMFFGNHCFNHLWLEHESKKKQDYEITQGLKFLKKIGMNLNKWIMCYPYGSYNNNTLKILRNKKCFIGFTSLNKAFNQKKYSRFEIPRIDCNNVFEY